MTEYVNPNGRVIPAPSGEGHVYSCHDCLSAGLQESQQEPFAGQYDAWAAFMQHTLDVHPALAPTPDGCAHCGVARHHHAHSYTAGVGGHFWTPPTDALRLARMVARREGSG